MKFDHIKYTNFEMFKCSLAAFIPIHLGLTALAMGFVIAAKWALMGRRKEGQLYAVCTPELGKRERERYIEIER